MPSTRSYPSGTHVMTTNGSGICWFTCASTNEAWSFSDLSADILRVRTTVGTLAQVVPRTITFPTVGTLTILTLTT